MRDIPLARQDMRFIQYFQAEDDPNVIIGYENPYRTERARCISVEDFYFEYLYGMAHSALTEGMHDIALALMAVQTQTTEILDEFPTKAAGTEKQTNAPA